MKRICLFIILGLMFFYAQPAFAAAAKIIDIQGEVLVRAGDFGIWKDALVGMELEKNSEVRTKLNSACTISFDANNDNIITLKAMTQIKMEGLMPVKAFLPKGRVLSLVGNIEPIENFQIRTPTAIAGARGTGWATEYNGEKTQIQCFDDEVYINSILDEAAGQKELASGFGLDVGDHFGEEYPLSSEQQEEWNDFIGYVDEISGGNEQSNADNGEEPSLPDDLRGDQKDDYSESFEENRRQEEEASDSRSRGLNGGGNESIGNP